MKKQEIQKIFDEFIKGYNQDEIDAIWKKQSEMFRNFWENKLINPKKKNLSDAEVNEIVRILDYHAKGKKKSDQTVATTMISQKAWKRMFNEINDKKELYELLYKILNEKEDGEKTLLIDRLYEINKSSNSLTGPNGNAVNTILFAFGPKKHISIISLRHREKVINFFGFNKPNFEQDSQGTKITVSNSAIINGFKFLGSQYSPRTISTFLYGSEIKDYWRNEGDDKDNIPWGGGSAINELEKKKDIIPIEEKYVTKFLQTLACSPPQPFQIETLLKFNREDRIIYNTEFQRSEVWDLPRKQKLIDSILRGYNINTIFLRQLSDGKYECLDGQQRLKTILREFLDNKFPVNPKLSPEFNRETFFDQLPESLKSKIKSFIIYAIIFYTDSDEETCKIFLRLQEGLPLNSAEKLNAMIGFLRNEIVELSKHSFIKKLGIKDHRFAHRYILAQAYLITLRNQITDIKFRNLQEIYSTYKQIRPSQGTADTTKKVLRFLDRSFGEDAKIIHFKADFLSIYLLTKHLIENYVTDDIKNQLKEFFIRFLIRVGEVESSEKEEDAAYYDYKTYRKASADSRNSIERRFNITLSKFLESVPNIKPKDPTRGFNYWEKLAVYWRDKGICQICGEKIPFEEGSIDHKRPHSKGGPTTIANGQWLCRKCNLKKLDKII